MHPDREHDTTSAKAAPDLLPALERAEQTGTATLNDLHCQNLSTAAIRHPYKKPKGGQLAERQRAYNQVIRGVY